jgi:hypothetical protein
MHLEAESYQDAAQQALGIHRDQESIATCFEVQKKSEHTAQNIGKPRMVDLSADGLTVNNIKMLDK